MVGRNMRQRTKRHLALGNWHLALQVRCTFGWKSLSHQQQQEIVWTADEVQQGSLGEIEAEFLGQVLNANC